jgi:opacity protein-like surface antigen
MRSATVHHFPFLFAALLLVSIVSAAPAASAATFSDATFNNADWTVTVEVLNLGGSVNGSQVTTGGNPGAFRRINNVLNSAAGQPFSNSVFGFHARAGATWNPGIQGAITSLAYEEDAYRYSGSGVQANGIALRQGGVIYYGPASLTPSTTGVWQHYAWSGLTAGDFDAVAPGVQNPDFSSAGGPIQFGFYRSNSTSVGGSGGTVSGGIDNWAVTVEQGATPAAGTSWGRIKAEHRR